MYFYGLDIDDYFNNFKLKPKHEKHINKSLHDTRLLNSIIGMLEYDNVYEGLDTRFLELYKIMDGSVGITKTKNGLVAFRGSFGGKVNEYGFGTEFVGASATNSYSIKDKETGVVGYNNKLNAPDVFYIEKYASILTELDISSKYNIQYARYNPLFAVKNQKLKQTIDIAFENMSDGKPLTILSDIANELMAEGVRPIETLNLTDVKNIDKLQYLLKAYDDIEKQFYRQYGIALNVTSKMAQQSESEVNQTQALAMVYPIERLKCANEMCDKLNKLYGGNMTVHFSEVWENEYKKYLSSVCVEPKTQELKNDELENEMEGVEENEV